MNHWLETAEVLSRVAALAAAGEPAALATVVRVKGSAYRRPGAKLLVEASGGGLGGVSGGCLEGDVREVGRRVLAGTAPRLLHYDTTAGDEEPWALGLGCRGEVDVFVQPATSGHFLDVLACWRERLAGETAFTVATVVAGAESLGASWLVDAEGTVVEPTRKVHSFAVPDAVALAVALRAPAQLATGRSACEEVAGHLVFFEVQQPPVCLLVCGAGDDAVPLVERALEAGFRVTVLDHREGLLRPGRFPAGAALVAARPEEPTLQLPAAAQRLAVVMTHSFASDREWVRRLLAEGLPYVGQLGPRARTEEIRRAIGAENDTRLFGPVGLDIGADGPRQVAISIVAELLAVVAGRTPHHLAARTEPIHVS